jgi:hypothetical protein
MALPQRAPGPVGGQQVRDAAGVALAPLLKHLEANIIREHDGVPPERNRLATTTSVKGPRHVN